MDRRKDRGVIQIPVMVGLMIMAVVLPLVIKLSQKSQETRKQAGSCSWYAPEDQCRQNPGWNWDGGDCVSRNEDGSCRDGCCSKPAEKKVEQCGGVDWQCDCNAQGSVKCLEGKQWHCGNDCCWHYDELKADPLACTPPTVVPTIPPPVQVCEGRNEGDSWCDGKTRKECKSGRIEILECNYACGDMGFGGGAQCQRPGGCETDSGVFQGNGAKWCEGNSILRCNEEKIEPVGMAPWCNGEESITCAGSSANIVYCSFGCTAGSCGGSPTPMPPAATPTLTEFQRTLPTATATLVPEVSLDCGLRKNGDSWCDGKTRKECKSGRIEILECNYACGDMGFGGGAQCQRPGGCETDSGVFQGNGAKWCEGNSILRCNEEKIEPVGMAPWCNGEESITCAGSSANIVYCSFGCTAGSCGASPTPMPPAATPTLTEFQRTLPTATATLVPTVYQRQDCGGLSQQCCREENQYGEPEEYCNGNNYCVSGLCMVKPLPTNTATVTPILVLTATVKPKDCGRKPDGVTECTVNNTFNKCENGEWFNYPCSDGYLCLAGNSVCTPKTCGGKADGTMECIASDNSYNKCENGTWKNYYCASGTVCLAGGSGCVAVTADAGCKEGEKKCSEDNQGIMVCQSDNWVMREKCSGGCSNSWGTVQCISCRGEGEGCGIMSCCNGLRCTSDQSFSNSPDRNNGKCVRRVESVCNRDDQCGSSCVDGKKPRCITGKCVFTEDSGCATEYKVNMAVTMVWMGTAVAGGVVGGAALAPGVAGVVFNPATQIALRGANLAYGIYGAAKTCDQLAKVPTPTNAEEIDKLNQARWTCGLSVLNAAVAGIGMGVQVAPMIAPALTKTVVPAVSVGLRVYGAAYATVNASLTCKDVLANPQAANNQQIFDCLQAAGYAVSSTLDGYLAVRQSGVGAATISLKSLEIKNDVVQAGLGAVNTVMRCKDAKGFDLDCAMAITSNMTDWTMYNSDVNDLARLKGGGQDNSVGGAVVPPVKTGGPSGEVETVAAGVLAARVAGDSGLTLEETRQRLVGDLEEIRQQRETAATEEIKNVEEVNKLLVDLGAKPKSDNETVEQAENRWVATDDTVKELENRTIEELAGKYSLGDVSGKTLAEVREMARVVQQENSERDVLVKEIDRNNLPVKLVEDGKPRPVEEIRSEVEVNITKLTEVNEGLEELKTEKRRSTETLDQAEARLNESKKVVDDLKTKLEQLGESYEQGRKTYSEFVSGAEAALTRAEKTKTSLIAELDGLGVKHEGIEKVSELTKIKAEAIKDLAVVNSKADELGVSLRKPEETIGVAEERVKIAEAVISEGFKELRGGGDKITVRAKVEQEIFTGIVADLEKAAGYKLRQEQIDLVLSDKLLLQMQAGGGKTTVIGPMLAAMEKRTVFAMPSSTDATAFVNDVVKSKSFYDGQEIRVVFYDNQRGFLETGVGFDRKSARVISAEIVRQWAGESGKGIMVITESADNGWGVIAGRRGDNESSRLLYEMVLGEKNFTLVVDEIGAVAGGNFSVSKGEAKKMAELTDPKVLYGYKNGEDLLRASEEVIGAKSLVEFKEKVLAGIREKGSAAGEFFEYVDKETGIRVRKPFPKDEALINRTYAELVDQSLAKVSGDLKKELTSIRDDLKKDSGEGARKKFEARLSLTGKDAGERVALADLSYRTAETQAVWYTLSRTPGNDFGYEGNEVVLRKNGGTTGETYSVAAQKIALQKVGAEMLAATGVEVKGVKAVGELTMTADSDQISNEEIFKIKAARGKLKGYDATPDTAANLLGVKATANSERPVDPSWMVRNEGALGVIEAGYRENPVEGKARALVMLDTGVGFRKMADQALVMDPKVEIVARTKFITEPNGAERTEYYIEKRNGEVVYRPQNQDEWSQRAHEYLSSDPSKLLIVFEGRTRAVDFKVDGNNKKIDWTVIASDENNMEEVTQAWKRNRVPAKVAELTAAGWTETEISEASKYNLWLVSDNQKLAAGNVVDHFNRVLDEQLANNRFEQAMKGVNRTDDVLAKVGDELVRIRPDKAEEIRVTVEEMMVESKRIERAQFMEIQTKPLAGEEIPREIYERGRQADQRSRVMAAEMETKFGLSGGELTDLKKTMGIEENYLSWGDFEKILREPVVVGKANPVGPREAVVYWAETNNLDNLPKMAWHNRSEVDRVALAKETERVASARKDLEIRAVAVGVRVNSGMENQEIEEKIAEVEKRKQQSLDLAKKKAEEENKKLEEARIERIKKNGVLVGLTDLTGSEKEMTEVVAAENKKINELNQKIKENNLNVKHQDGEAARVYEARIDGLIAEKQKAVELALWKGRVTDLGLLNTEGLAVDVLRTRVEDVLTALENRTEEKWNGTERVISYRDRMVAMIDEAEGRAKSVGIEVATKTVAQINAEFKQASRDIGIVASDLKKNGINDVVINSGETAAAFRIRADEAIGKKKAADAEVAVKAAAETVRRQAVDEAKLLGETVTGEETAEQLKTIISRGVEKWQIFSGVNRAPGQEINKFLTNAKANRVAIEGRAKVFGIAVVNKAAKDLLAEIEPKEAARAESDLTKSFSELRGMVEASKNLIPRMRQGEDAERVAVARQFRNNLQQLLGAWNSILSRYRQQGGKNGQEIEAAERDLANLNQLFVQNLGNQKVLLDENMTSQADTVISKITGLIDAKTGESNRVAEEKRRADQAEKERLAREEAKKKENLVAEVEQAAEKVKQTRQDLINGVYALRNINEEETEIFKKEAKQGSGYIVELLGTFMPQKVLEIGGQIFYLPMGKSTIDGDVAVAYVVENGKVEPRYFYKSDSEGFWRATPGVRAKDKQWSKGSGISYSQETRLPFVLNKYLEELPKGGVIATTDLPVLNENEIKNTFGRRVKVFGNGPEIEKLEEYQPGELTNRPGVDYVKVFQNFKYPNGFIPDFSKKPLEQRQQNHSIFGLVTVRVYETEYLGRPLRWEMSTDVEGRVWVSNLYLADSLINSYGVREEVVLAGALLNKPLDYKNQVSGVEMGVGRYPTSLNYAYHDITPLLDNLEPIKSFRLALGIKREEERKVVVYSYEEYGGNEKLGGLDGLWFRIYKDKDGNAVAIESVDGGKNVYFDFGDGGIKEVLQRNRPIILGKIFNGLTLMVTVLGPDPMFSFESTANIVTDKDDKGLIVIRISDDITAMNGKTVRLDKPIEIKNEVKGNKPIFVSIVSVSGVREFDFEPLVVEVDPAKKTEIEAMGKEMTTMRDEMAKVRVGGLPAVLAGQVDNLLVEIGKELEQQGQVLAELSNGTMTEDKLNQELERSKTKLEDLKTKEANIKNWKIADWVMPGQKSSQQMVEGGLARIEQSRQIAMTIAGIKSLDTAVQLEEGEKFEVEDTSEIAKRAKTRYGQGFDVSGTVVEIEARLAKEEAAIQLVLAQAEAGGLKDKVVWKEGMPVADLRKLLSQAKEKAESKLKNDRARIEKKEWQVKGMNIDDALYEGMKDYLRTLDRFNIVRLLGRTEEVAGKQVKMVRTDQIVDAVFNGDGREGDWADMAEQRRTKSDFIGLLKSIRDKGFDKNQPLEVVDFGGGVYAVVNDGSHRLTAAKALDLKYVPVIVSRPVDEIDENDSELLAAKEYVGELLASEKPKVEEQGKLPDRIMWEVINGMWRDRYDMYGFEVMQTMLTRMISGGDMADMDKLQDGMMEEFEKLEGKLSGLRNEVDSQYYEVFIKRVRMIREIGEGKVRLEKRVRDQSSELINRLANDLNRLEAESSIINNQRLLRREIEEMRNYLGKLRNQLVINFDWSNYRSASNELDYYREQLMAGKRRLEGFYEAIRSEPGEDYSQINQTIRYLDSFTLYWSGLRNEWTKINDLLYEGLNGLGRELYDFEGVVKKKENLAAEEKDKVVAVVRVAERLGISIGGIKRAEEGEEEILKALKGKAEKLGMDFESRVLAGEGMERMAERFEDSIRRRARTMYGQGFDVSGTVVEIEARMAKEEAAIQLILAEAEANGLKDAVVWKEGTGVTDLRKLLDQAVNEKKAALQTEVAKAAEEQKQQQLNIGGQINQFLETGRNNLDRARLVVGVIGVANIAKWDDVMKALSELETEKEFKGVDYVRLDDTLRSFIRDRLIQKNLALSDHQLNQLVEYVRGKVAGEVQILRTAERYEIGIGDKPTEYLKQEVIDKIARLALRYGIDDVRYNGESFDDYIQRLEQSIVKERLRILDKEKQTLSRVNAGYSIRGLTEEEIKFLEFVKQDSKQPVVTRRLLSNIDFFPKEVVEVEGIRYFQMSNIIRADGGNGRDQLIMYVLLDDGRLVPRVLYKSMSDGGVAEYSRIYRESLFKRKGFFWRWTLYSRNKTGTSFDRLSRTEREPTEI